MLLDTVVAGRLARKSRCSCNGRLAGRASAVMSLFPDLLYLELWTLETLVR